jgi:hypothetical protein
MYTFKIIYSYKPGKRTQYFEKMFTVARVAGGFEEAGRQVRTIFAKEFEQSTLLGVRFLYYEEYVVRTGAKLSSKAVIETLSYWDADPQSQA